MDTSEPAQLATTAAQTARLPLCETPPATANGPPPQTTTAALSGRSDPAITLDQAAFAPIGFNPQNCGCI